MYVCVATRVYVCVCGSKVCRTLTLSGTGVLLLSILMECNVTVMTVTLSSGTVVTDIERCNSPDCNTDRWNSRDCDIERWNCRDCYIERTNNRDCNTERWNSYDCVEMWNSRDCVMRCGTATTEC